MAELGVDALPIFEWGLKLVLEETQARGVEGERGNLVGYLSVCLYYLVDIFLRKQKQKLLGELPLWRIPKQLDQVKTLLSSALV